ncbi:hypothetical protein ACFU7T_32620 [Streptomyces sp. NPDC057555]|uniref:hypothetical protein n=1 Tax=Streptomyces sp. NPDC057555 TaxID=3346166 RepID=UPI0036D155DE
MRTPTSPGSADRSTSARSRTYGADVAPARVCLDSETAWRLCTRGIEPATALTHAGIEGDRQLAEAVCQIVSIVY